MSLLFREKRDLAGLEIAYARGGYGTSSGIPITEATAERHSAVWACRAAVAEALQQLPVEEVRTTNGNTVHRVPPSVFYDPAPGWTWEQWIWAQAWSMSGAGKCYAYIATVSSTGWPTSLVPIDPSVVSWRWLRGENRWKITVGGEEEQRWPLGRLWHCPLYVTTACPEGMSPIRHHAETIGVGLAAQKFGAQFFGDGGHPTMIISPEEDPGETGARALKTKVMQALQGNREPIVLPQSTKVIPWQVAPNESQFLETLRYSGEDVARVFGVPPEKIGLSVSGTQIKYANVTARNEDWRVSGLSRYIIPFESALSRLVPAGNQRTIRFDFDAFLRADTVARASWYKTAADIGTISGTPLLTTNEMRNAEGMSPLPGGDEFKPPQLPAATQTRSDHGVTVVVPEQRIDPVFNVTIPEQAAPVVNVTMPRSAQVNVEAPRQSVTRTVKRDADGRIEKIVEET